MSNTYRLREPALFHRPAPRPHKQRIRLSSREEIDPPAGGGAFLIAASAVAGLGVWAALLTVIF